MTRFVPRPALLLVIACTLAAVGLWLAFDNPEVDGTSRGDGYTCLAPWDTVLNGADNMPGGETPPDAEGIGARCRESGRTRFVMSAASVSAAVVLTALGVAVVRRRSRE